MKAHAEKQFLDAYDAHADAIFRHCFFRVFSRVRAEELTQETFMRTWQYIEDGKHIENLRAFLYRVANNLVIDESRKKKEESLDHRLELSDALEPASDDHLHMMSAVAAKEVHEAIALLPQDYRDIVIMRYVDDLDPAEIASLLGITANNVSVKLNRATHMLRNTFSNDKPTQEA